jgi:hypothetical protein
MIMPFMAVMDKAMLPIEVAGSTGELQNVG